MRRGLRPLVAAAIVAAGLGVGWRGYRSAAGAPVDRLSDTWHEGVRVLDREGRLLRELPSEVGQRGQPVPLDRVGDRVIWATLVSEDKGFFEHDGIDRQAAIRALGQNLRHGRVVSGASTISQQLVKLLDNEGRPRPRSLAEKLREAARAQNLEQAAAKETILEAYLNRLSYGHGLVGPEAAAQGYFGVASRDLSWAQAAFLAVLPRAPSFLDPFEHKPRVLVRQAALLDALFEAGVLSEADIERARSEPIEVRRPARPMFAPHFIEALRREGDLGSSGEDRGVVRTTIDLDLQRDVEGLVRTHLAAIEGRNASNAAVIVVDNRSGDLLAYVGSADFFSDRIGGQVDMARALRQPGSTLKPFVYALAFEQGMTGADMLADVPARFPEGGRGEYTPSNFHGGYEGPISAREALAGSLNIPAIRLAADLGPDSLLNSLHSFGFSSLDRSASHYGAALALGSGEVKLIELARAYVTLARGGDKIALRARLDAPAASGPTSGERVIKPVIAAEITDILADPLARVRGLHGKGPFDIGFPVAVKTGTSSGHRDAFTAGYTRERTAVVWVGNADGSPTRELLGSSGAGPLFADVMRRAMRDVPTRAPLWDEGLLAAAEVCPLSGKLPGPACPEHVARRFARGHEPGESCDVHVKASRRPDASPGEPPFRCDPSGAHAIAVFPDVYSEWLASLPLGAEGRDSAGVLYFSRSRVPGCSEEAGGAPELRVDRPEPGSVFSLSPFDREERQMIELSASLSAGGGFPVEFVVDGEVVARSAYPYRARIPARLGDHEVVARPADPSLPIRVRSSRFSVR
ncbi:MAG TPA: penicillin-binding protein 1C [Polyangiaceae bacterium]|nr:penicillin-binding protein 1C [Polyangiaceae bacterium]